MATTQQIWILSKRRFLQEAGLWMFSNKSLEVITIVGGVIAFYLFEYVSDKPDLIYGTISGVATIAAITSAFAMFEREKYFEGYSQGFEIGFEAGSNHNDDGTEEGTKSMDDEVMKGVANTKGYIFNRVNIYDKTPWE